MIGRPRSASSASAHASARTEAASRSASSTVSAASATRTSIVGYRAGSRASRYTPARSSAAPHLTSERTACSYRSGRVHAAGGRNVGQCSWLRYRWLCQPVSTPSQIGEFTDSTSRVASHERIRASTWMRSCGSGIATWTRQAQAPPASAAPGNRRASSRQRRSARTCRAGPVRNGGSPTDTSRAPACSAASRASVRCRTSSARSSARRAHGRVDVPTWYAMNRGSTRPSPRRTTSAATGATCPPGSNSRNSSSTPTVNIRRLLGPPPPVRRACQRPRYPCLIRWE